MEISEEAINDLVFSTDTNKDGSIDIDEFMESFRLVDKKLERGKSLFMPSSEVLDGSQEEHLPQATGKEGGLLAPPQ